MSYVIASVVLTGVQSLVEGIETDEIDTRLKFVLNIKHVLLSHQLLQSLKPTAEQTLCDDERNDNHDLLTDAWNKCHTFANVVPPRCCKCCGVPYVYRASTHTVSYRELSDSDPRWPIVEAALNAR